MYSVDVCQYWDVLAPHEERVQEFKNVIVRALSFLKSSSDQMPAYKGWSNDYDMLIKYLNDMVIYDICNNNHYFKFNNSETHDDREKLAEEICSLLTKMSSGIKEKQNDMEKRIFGEK